MALWVTEPFWKHCGASFSGAPLLWGGFRLFLYGFRGVGFGSGATGGNGGLVGLHQ